MPSTPQRTLFAALFLSTGAALLTYILSGVSLLATVLLVLLGALVGGALIWRQLTTPAQADLRRTILAGALAGLLATAAYDISRYLLVEIAGFTFWPFDIFTIFGQALVGVRFHGPFVAAAGVAYHLANGIGFAIAYTVWLGRRGVWAGIAWAIVLETLMVSVYPGWLGLQALDEFLQISILGHVVYGSVLGYSAQHLLMRNERTRDVRT